ncbi:hypothetical protein NLJ89_g2251 [Agrocybe chaxingu]|uniref:Major facilitator superfamily (MFS) profile domain-containing protein n=1 Tax=Agrocybe chaxingu TaxID=84603 RepID=A0A9W8K6Z0_9AGAR|nr:hypothetical protein NLJ89_g2251 [Agrocybe chaxingu]
MTTDSNHRVDEETPLLHDVRPRPSPKRTPLPKLQIAIVLLLQICEPITSQSIFPYINQLISELDITGGDERKVGYYAGLIESLFFATEALTVLQWSRASDHVGRKPVLLIGLFGIVRCLTGLLNGNIGVMKSVMGELTDPTNRAEGFSLMPVVWGFGATMGPLLGGSLSKPHERFPKHFGGAFWKNYPYFLPCLVTSSYVLFSFMITLVFFKETVPKRHADKQDNSEAIAAHDGKTSHQHDEPLPLRGLFVYPVILSVSNYVVLAFLNIALCALLPLFLAMPLDIGGLDFDPPKIGYIMGSYGAGSAIFQAFYFARIVRYFGERTVYIMAISTMVPVFLSFPIINMLAVAYGQQSIQVWAVIVVLLALLAFMDMAYGTIFMFITSSAPNKRSLGATNGLSQTIVSIARAIGPALSTSLFSFSVQKDILSGYGVYALSLLSGMNGVADIHGEEQSPFLKSKPRRTPLPKSQIVIVLLMQIVEPLCSQSIYPYINELVGSLDIVGGDKSKVGYYAGLIESLFYATEALTVFQWSRASDHVGRKPVLMLGMIGTMLSMLLFGLSRTLVTLILSRAFCGVLNGNIGVMKSALGELTDTTNRAEAFALMPAVWAFGATMGPLLGGLLARPADRFPVGFASDFWKKFPYFLPCAATASYVFAVLLITGLFFEETVQCVKPLQGGKASSCSPSSSSSSYKLLAISPDGELDPDERPVSFRGLFTFAVIVSIANYAALGFLSISINALLPLFLHTPIELGGLNLDPARIGYIMGLYGAGMGLFQMLFFAKIVRRWGTRRVFILSMATFVPVFMLFPVVSLIAKRRSLSWGLLFCSFISFCHLSTLSLNSPATMSALVGKAGKKLFENHLEQYAPADPLYEYYTENGKEKRRKRELPPGLSKRDQAILRSVKKRAHYLDKGFHICGMRFGWTFFISLIPIVGDVVDASLNYLLVVRKARKADIPSWLLRRMLFNNAISAAVSIIPIAGDLVLAMYKANSRNAALLEEFLRIRGDEFLKRGGVVEDPKAKKGMVKSKKAGKAQISNADAEQVKPGAGMTPTEVKNAVDPAEAKNSTGGAAAASASSSSSKKKGSSSGSSGSGFNLFGSRLKRTAASPASPAHKGRFVENVDSAGSK